jgi:hypothetical protein
MLYRVHLTWAGFELITSVVIIYDGAIYYFISVIIHSSIDNMLNWTNSLKPLYLLMYVDGATVVGILKQN